MTAPANESWFNWLAATGNEDQEVVGPCCPCHPVWDAGHRVPEPWTGGRHAGPGEQAPSLDLAAWWAVACGRRWRHMARIAVRAPLREHYGPRRDALGAVDQLGDQS